MHGIHSRLPHRDYIQIIVKVILKISSNDVKETIPYVDAGGFSDQVT